MSEDMRGRSWRALASQAAASRFNSLKGYLAQQDIKNSISNTIQRQLGPGNDRSRANGRQGWREWAGQKISRGYGNSGTERIALFPGWAARRFPQSARDESFHVDVYVAGFATVHRAPELASRSQRAFMRLARGFAALPRLEDRGYEESVRSTQLTPSTEDLLNSVNLPPRPTEMTEEREVEMLERHFRRMNAQKEGSMNSTDSTASRSSSVERDDPVTSVPNSNGALMSTKDSLSSAVAISDELLRKLHENLDARLRPFWSSVVPGRTVRLHLFAAPNGNGNTDEIPADASPLATQEVQTSVDGSFQTMFHIGWERMCQHPAALHIAFGDPSEEHDFVVAVELLPPPRLTSASVPNLHETESGPDVPPSTAKATVRVPLTHSPIRVISDIDDTVKHSNIPGGAREVFHNVFVKELEDLVIPGMGEWYTSMWKKGVRFHYVSNGPFELLPILGDFFKISSLPPGSMKLKSYAGRSLFSGLLSAPAAKKRAGVQEIMDAFPHSQFLLIGDTGEQDLELYADLAKEKPDQVLGIFIRDAGSGDPLEDPIGIRLDFESYSEPDPAPMTPYIKDNTLTPAQRKASTEDRAKQLPPIDTSYAVRKPRSRSSKTPATGTGNSLAGNYFTPSRMTTEPDSLSMYDSAQNPSMTSLSSAYSRNPKTPSTATSTSGSTGYFSAPTPKTSTSTTTNVSTRIPEAERKRHELQMRVYRARVSIPEHIILRVFRSPSECVETEKILSSH
ncbi:actin cytoskeleton organization protein app1 [Moniliophthora roreri]|uniref:Phosphatidate phosphatase APP1 catalytic domain-containing protein n=1 Tax=Moniliophthora roreri TaxID=221103 RepID=A0A0W0FVE2_MONRR|nr:actin cytoskeleton organization protein app1 [Moniliophthora roreri]